jgi:UDP-N-acetylglucosamine 3-dehydrogenase
MLKSCIIGLGAMGRNHARVAAEVAGTKLVGLADPSEQNRTIAQRVAPGVNVYADYREMLEAEKPHMATLAVPTDLHCELACAVLARGVHVMVEKPIAPSIAEADKMIAAGVLHNRKLMVGHIERFNPAVQEMRRLVAEKTIGKIFQLHARRLSPFPSRIQDVGVILDLATHDIDAMHFITGSKVVRAFAETARQAHKSCEDMVSGLLRFESGEIGLLDVSWLSPVKVREITVIGEGGMLVADYLSQDLRWYKNGKANESWTAATNFSGAVEGDMIKTYIPKKEPLRSEHEEFAACILENRTPQVSGETGRAALDVALRLMQSGSAHSVS